MTDPTSVFGVVDDCLVTGFQAELLLFAMLISCASDDVRGGAVQLPAAVNEGTIDLASDASLHTRRRLVYVDEGPASRRRGRHDGAQLHDDADQSKQQDGVPGHGCHRKLVEQCLAVKWVQRSICYTMLCSMISVCVWCLS